jgi:hypothetical protein
VDLGMSILDVSMGDQKVVTGGVVTAEGYDPIIITQTEENTPPSKDSGKAKEKKQSIDFGESTTVVFTIIFVVLLFALVATCSIKQCKNDLTESKLGE